MNHLEKAQIEKKIPMTEGERNKLILGLVFLASCFLSVKILVAAENMDKLILSLISAIGFGAATVKMFKLSMFAHDAKIKKQIVMGTLDEIFYEENPRHPDGRSITIKDPKKHIYWDDLVYEVRRYNLVAKSSEKIKSIMIITTNGAPVTYSYRIIYCSEDQQKIVDTHSYDSLCAHELILF